MHAAFPAEQGPPYRHLLGTCSCRRGERRGEADGAMETRGEGLADAFVKLNGKQNAAHAPRRKKGGGGKNPNMKARRIEKLKKETVEN